MQVEDMNDLPSGEELMVNPDVTDWEGNSHLLFDGGECVTIFYNEGSVVLNEHGEVQVETVMTEPGAAPFLAFVHPVHLMTKAEVQATYHGAVFPDDKRVEEEENSVIYSYVPHPDYPNLPAFETLPLGYVMGLTAYVARGGQPPVDPLVAAYMATRLGTTFPTA